MNWKLAINAALTLSLVAPSVSQANTAALDEQLKRWPGQTEFLNHADGYEFLRGGIDKSVQLESVALSGTRSDGSAKREVQESDVFKVGPNSEKLYLLNNYRGLIEADFSGGADKARISDRLDTYGNLPTAMYSDYENESLVLLDNYFWDRSDNSHTPKSRMALVSTDGLKNIDEEVLLGHISDSRKVGDIYYVATRSVHWRNEKQSNFGMVYALKVEDGQIEKIAEHKLTLPVSWNETMNIVEVPLGEVDGEMRYNYYLIAITQGGWAWWRNSQSQVEVIDITDAEGTIKPNMVANIKGQVRERSYTSIKDNTLVVVSNYTENNRLHTAVETFGLRTGVSSIITEEEAERRLLNARKAIIDERELTFKDQKNQEIMNSVEAEAQKRLLADSKDGIKNLFIGDLKGNYRKAHADHIETAHHGDGQNVNIQDVRFMDNNLYVFWVPRPQTNDPLDLFDISNVQNGAKYIGREHFDGNVTRAFPVRYEGKDYVVGLGQGQKTVNAGEETNVWFPQVTMFEIGRKKDGVTPKRPRRLTRTLLSSNDNVRSAFEGADKNVDFRFNSETGTGVILYPVTAGWWGTGNENKGARLIGFDLNAAMDEEDDEAAVEGALLKGSTGYLQRVFRNSELELIHSLTSEALASHDEPTDAIGAADQVAKSYEPLELVRDIRDYISHNGTEIQVVANGHSWRNSENNSVELRVVETPDAEKDQVVATHTLKGSFAGAFVDKKNSVAYIATHLFKQNTWKEVDGVSKSNEDGFSKHFITPVLLSEQGASLANPIELVASEISVKDDNFHFGGPGFGRGLWWGNWWLKTVNFQTHGDTVLATMGTAIYPLTASAATVEALKVSEACAIAEVPEIAKKDESDENSLWGPTKYVSPNQVLNLNGELVLFIRDVVIDPERSKNTRNQSSKVHYTRNHIQELTIEGDNLVCGMKRHIPGFPMSFSQTEDKLHLITQDTSVADINKHVREQVIDWDTKEKVEYTHYRVYTDARISVVQLAGQTTLTDTEKTNRYPDLKKTDAGELVSFSPGKSGKDQNSPFYPPNLNTYGVSNDGALDIKVDVLDTFRTERYARLADVVQGKDGETLFVVRDYQSVSVLRKSAGEEPEVLSVRLANGKSNAFSEKASLPYSWYGNANFTYNANSDSLVYTAGKYGVYEIELSSN